MVHQPVNNTAEIKLIYNLDGGPDINSTLYMRDDVNAWDGASLSALADAAHAWWDAHIKPLQNAALVLAEIVTRDLEAEFGFTFTKSEGHPGTRAGTPVSGAICGLVHFTGDPGSAPRKGTIFHPGASEADIDGNLFTQAYADALKAGYDFARDMPGATPTWALVIVSRYSGFTLHEKPDGTKVKRPTKRNPALTNTIGDTTVPRRYGIQKRRRPSPL